MQTIYAMSFYKFKFIWIQMGCVKVAKVFYYFWYSELESEWKQLGSRCGVPILPASYQIEITKPFWYHLD